MPRDLTVPVESNLDLGHGNYLLGFDAPEIASEMRPGQFFMIGLPHADVLLRRPFSVCGLPGTFEGSGLGRMNVLYKVVGSGTALLSALGPGAPLLVLGPLGRGFTVPGSKSTQPVFVAGGIGSAPFPALASRLVPPLRPPRMLYGARSSGDLPLLDWFRARCSTVEVTTDDGSLGARGLVTSALEDLLAREPRQDLLLYACGPEPMLRAVRRIATRAGVPCELSLEAHMACGFGVCLGCVVPTCAGPWGEGGYERVCVEGPVMPAERLAW